MVQNRPITLTFPAEYQNCLLGGEGLIKGFQKRHPLRRRVPHFWFPRLQLHVLHSEILDQHFEVTCTKRLVQLVDQHYGFDSYILETPPQDLKTNLALKLKRRILLALARKDFLPNDPAKRDELYAKYQKYVLPLEEAEWYGLTLAEALKKLEVETAPPVVEPRPLKLKFREDFIQQLRDEQLAKTDALASSSSKSWSSLLKNPFSSGKNA